MGSKVHIIQPKTHSLIPSFIDTLKEEKFDIISKSNQPSHVVFPQIVKENIEKINCSAQSQVLKQYLALKSTYSKSLILAAKNCGIGAEVSTFNELNLVGELGFDNIIAGGPKSIQYLKEAINRDVIISIDSIDELQRIISITKIQKQIGKDISNSKIKILIRVSDPICENRVITMKVSRFGICRKELDECYRLIEENLDCIELKGFHFHADGYDAEMKRGFCKYFLDETMKLQRRGISSITIINIGGGFRESTLKNPQEWLYLIQDVEKTLLGKEDLKIWGDYTFGITLNPQDRLLGRNYAESFGIKPSIETDLQTLLHTPIVENTYSLEQVAQELGISIIIEPGFMLSNNAGISIFEVIGTKKTSCESNLVFVNGHMFNLSTNMIEHLTDPILINNTDEKLEGNSFEGYIVGTLCREDDFLMRRKIQFSKKLEEKDLLIFINTGSYAMSYENCSPQRFNKPKYVCAEFDSSLKEWNLEEESSN